MTPGAARPAGWALAGAARWRRQDEDAERDLGVALLLLLLLLHQSMTTTSPIHDLFNSSSSCLLLLDALDRRFSAVISPSSYTVICIYAIFF